MNFNNELDKKTITFHNLKTFLKRPQGERLRVNVNLDTVLEIYSKLI